MSLCIPSRSSAGLPLQASKWQKVPMLVDADEMRSLFASLGKFWIVQTSGVVRSGEEVISEESFLELYQNYIIDLKRGESPVEPRMRAYFSAILTVYPEALYTVKINSEQCLVKVHQPVVQMQMHRFDYSFADHSFRSMGMGANTIPWGIQFSYPHLYQDDSLQVLTVKEGAQFPNTLLFKTIQRWSRTYTIATPFEVEGKETNVPIRLGKNCLSWINTLPQLQAKGLRVGTSEF